MIEQPQIVFCEALETIFGDLLERPSPDFQGWRQWGYYWKRLIDEDDEYLRAVVHPKSGQMTLMVKHDDHEDQYIAQTPQEVYLWLQDVLGTFRTSFPPGPYKELHHGTEGLKWSWGFAGWSGFPIGAWHNESLLDQPNRVRTRLEMFQLAWDHFFYMKRRGVRFWATLNPDHERRLCWVPVQRPRQNNGHQIIEENRFELRDLNTGTVEATVASQFDIEDMGEEWVVRYSFGMVSYMGKYLTNALIEAERAIVGYDP